MMLLDIHMDAPLIVVPGESESADAVVVDLGKMHVGNRIQWLLHGTSRKASVLHDVMEVRHCAAPRLRLDSLAVQYVGEHVCRTGRVHMDC